ncbi:MAG: hypothetical protein Q9217_000979 [Psora testacea]
MADLQDTDGDSQMGNASSPSTDNEDAMFPAASTDPTTERPADPNILSSPLASQEQQNGGGDAMETAEGDDSGATYARVDHLENAQGQYMPGASWNNQKARDEWQRAWAMLEDKGFSLKEYGDPFDETLEENQGWKQTP